MAVDAVNVTPQEEDAGRRKDGLSDLLKANEATEETQAARLEALKGRTCLWITAPVIPMMSAVLMARVRWAKRQGVVIVAVFNSPEDKLYSVMGENGLMDKSVFADLHSKAVSQNVVNAVREANLSVDAVFSPYEQCQTIVGEVGTLMGLQANSARAYTVARSKDLTREACAAANVPTPRARPCSTREELAAALEHVGFPCILKPSSGAGSAGVHRANNTSEAERAFDLIIADVGKNANLNWNPGVERNTCLVEELLEGPEFDTDVLMWDSKAVFMRTVDNWPCIPPYFLETGSNMPSLFTPAEVSALESYAIDCVRACGFTFGCFHVESILTKDGPRLIEVNARQGGGSMQEFNELMHDVDVFANFFIGSFGIPINPPVTPQKFAMADYSITCPVSGIIEDIDFVDQVRAHPSVVRCTSFVKAGDKVTGYDSGFPIWLGEILVKGETAQEACDIVNEIVEALKINITPEAKGAALSGSAEPPVVSYAAAEAAAETAKAPAPASESVLPAMAL